MNLNKGCIEIIYVRRLVQVRTGMNLNKGCIEIVFICDIDVVLDLMNLNKGCIEIRINRLEGTER